jgi:hypothetical protein
MSRSAPPRSRSSLRHRIPTGRLVGQREQTVFARAAQHGSGRYSPGRRSTHENTSRRTRGLSLRGDSGELSDWWTLSLIFTFLCLHSARSRLPELHRRDLVRAHAELQQRLLRLGTVAGREVVRAMIAWARRKCHPCPCGGGGPPSAPPRPGPGPRRPAPAPAPPRRP